MLRHLRTLVDCGYKSLCPLTQELGRATPSAWHARAFAHEPSGLQDYQQTHLLDRPQVQGSKRVTSAQRKAARTNLRGPDRTLRREQIPVPPEVEVLSRGTRLYFSGPLGVTAIDLQKVDSRGLGAFKVEPGLITVVGPCRALVGTVSTLIQNKITGVVRGYLIYLQLVGVGYRVSKETKPVQLNVPNQKRLGA